MLKCFVLVSLNHALQQHERILRVVKSSRLPAKIATFLVSIGRLLCLAFLCGWRFLNKISLDWLRNMPKLGNFPYNSLYIFSNFEEKIAWRVLGVMFATLRCCGYGTFRLHAKPTNTYSKSQRCVLQTPPMDVRLWNT